MKSWESKYSEKSRNESHTYIFKSLEIKQYVSKYLRNYGFVVHRFKVHFSGSTLNLFISIYETERQPFIETRNQKIKKEKKLDLVKNLRRHSKKSNISFSRIKKMVRNLRKLNILSTVLKKKVNKLKIYNEKQLKSKALKKSISSNRISRLADISQRLLLKQKKTLNNQLTLNLRKSYEIYAVKQNKQKLDKLKILKSPSSFSKLDLLNSLAIFTNNKLPIRLKIKQINSTKHVNKVIENTSKPNSQELILLKLRRFQGSPFFKEGKHLILTLVNKPNSANLLATFISTHLKTIKRHNYFFNFLKENLQLALNQKSSKIQGVKIVIKGRLNNAARSKHRIISIGKTPIITIKSDINYAKSTTFTLNGTIGIKVWVCEKKKN